MTKIIKDLFASLKKLHKLVWAIKATRVGLGVAVHPGAVGNASFKWSEIASISSGKTEQEGSPISVRAPVLHLTSGRKVPVGPASTYSGNTAAHTAAELDRLRQQFSR